ncbi:flavin reductase family protein [Pseudogracilibacillus sp. SO30301A]|uniref:flavin reductase family protein n=1 Tax=Pseudogracilibacillus sp. SO30301A TaxID=3098291 RepID=UPI00300DE795
MDYLKEKFIESMSRLASGITVVTTEVNGRPWGMTVSACCSISVEPNLLLISLKSDSKAAISIKENNGFCVNVLSEKQQKIAKAGAIPQAPKFFEEYIVDEALDPFSIENALASIHCITDKKVEAGDHTLFIGKVTNVLLSEDREGPLLYFGRNFGYFAERSIV